MRPLLTFMLLLITLTACGPLPEQLQPTIAAAVEGTVTAQVAATAAVIATAEADTCSDAKLQAYVVEVDQLVSRYEAQAEVVAATPRVGLGTPLQALLEYEDQARELEAPECLAEYNTAIFAMMQRYRAGYQAFAAQDASSAALLAEAEIIKTGVKDGIRAINEGQIPRAIVLPGTPP